MAPISGLSIVLLYGPWTFGMPPNLNLTSATWLTLANEIISKYNASRDSKISNAGPDQQNYAAHSQAIKIINNWCKLLTFGVVCHIAQAATPTELVWWKCWFCKFAFLTGSQSDWFSGTFMVDHFPSIHSSEKGDVSTGLKVLHPNLSHSSAGAGAFLQVVSTLHVLAVNNGKRHCFRLWTAQEAPVKLKGQLYEGFLSWQNKHNLPSCIKYIHIVMQPLLPSTSRTFFIFPNLESPSSFHMKSLYSPFPDCDNHHSTFCLTLDPNHPSLFSNPPECAL